MEQFFDAKLTPAQLLFEVLRTQAYVKALSKQLLGISKYPGRITNQDSGFLKTLIDFVEQNRAAFPDPDALIKSLLDQMTE